jgi:hypothetical protein
MNIWSFIRSDMEGEWTSKREKERRKLVKLKILQLKLSLFMESRVNYMPKKGIKKKLK